MNQDKLNREWMELAPAWIREAREGVNPFRMGLLDEPMLQACGEVTALRVLKPGGRFVVANLHLMRSAVGGWHRTSEDE